MKYVLFFSHLRNIRLLLSKWAGVEIHSFRSHISGIHSQNSGIHSQKSDSNHYFGVDSTII